MESNINITGQRSNNRPPSPPPPQRPLPPSNSSATDIQSLSLDSFNHATERLLETNEEVLRSFLDKKNKSWSKELSDLVERYLANNKLTLEWCSVLDRCCKEVDHMESSMRFALLRYEEEHYSEEETSERYSKTTEEIAGITMTGNPLTDQRFFESFDSVYLEQCLILEWSQSKKGKLDNKLKKLNTWRRVLIMMSVVAFMLLFILSVVVAIFRAPFLVVTLVAAITSVTGSIGLWLSSLLHKWDTNWRGWRKIINSVEIASFMVTEDLNSLRRLIDTFQSEFEVLLLNAHFVMRADGTTVVIGMEKIKRKIDGFSKTIHNFHELVNKCKESIRMTRTMALRTIMDPPSISPQQDNIINILFQSLS